MAEHDRYGELADFLRTRRERLDPTFMGIPERTRRRTKGLRREEVAERADISVTWYTWLEQGRSIRLSESALNRLADALLLNPAERLYLFTLARPDLPLNVSPVEATSTPELQHLLDAQDANPAQLLGPRLEVMAWNRTSGRVFVDFGRLPPSEHHLVWQMFANPAMRRMIVDWEAHAKNLLAVFRAQCGRFPGDPACAALISALQETSEEFRTWWPRHDVGGQMITRKELNHPTVGRLVLEQHVFHPHEPADFTILLYTPLPGTGTASKLHQLAALHVPRTGAKYEQQGS